MSDSLPRLPTPIFVQPLFFADLTNKLDQGLNELLRVRLLLWHCLYAYSAELMFELLIFDNMTPPSMAATIVAPFIAKGNHRRTIEIWQSKLYWG